MSILHSVKQSFSTCGPPPFTFDDGFGAVPHYVVGVVHTVLWQHRDQFRVPLHRQQQIVEVVGDGARQIPQPTGRERNNTEAY